MKRFKSKEINLLIILVAMVLFCCFVFMGCASDGTNNGGNSTPQDTGRMDNLGGGGTGTTPTEVDYSTTTSSVLSSASINLSGYKTNTTYSEGEITTLGSDGKISSAGNYLLTGTYSNGIEISVDKGATVHLFLDGATISSTETAGIIKSDKAITVIITALDGTTNTISTTCDGENALHVKGTLVINGRGTLNVVGASSDSSAIKVSKTCIIVDATVKLTASKHGISAETIECEDAKINVSSAEKDGLHSECDYDNKKGETYEFTYSSGFVYLKNTAYTCSVSGDGIQADTFVYIDGGTTNITTTGNFVKYSSNNLTTYGLITDDFRYIKNGNSYQKVASDYSGSLTNRYALTQSSKGIKVGEIEYDTDGDDEDDATITEGGYTIYINSGDFVITSSDDAIHTNSGNVVIKGGTFKINTNDDGITADLLTQIDGGTIEIQSSYEGIEGAYVKITGGDITIFASDDGINSASDDTSITEYIIISGGKIKVDANGDGLDSNGSILMTGGEVTVCGPTSNADGALDAENGILVNGGTLIAYSSLGMVETPATNSEQYVISYGQNSSIASGTTIAIKNSDGETILSFTTEKACGSVILSCPALTSGETYNLYIGSTLTSTFTISSKITTLGASANFGGGGNMGGGGFNPGQNGGTPPAKPGN